MKNTFLLIALAACLVACKKEEVEEDNNPTELCNCGLIVGESWDQAAGTFSVTIESECSGRRQTFPSSLETYQQFTTGDRLCRNNVDPW